MSLNVRTTNLINNIKTVYIQTVSGNMLGDFEKIYASYSKSSLKISNKTDNNGTIYSTTLRINYPGLDESSFPELASFLNERFIPTIILNTGHIYQLTTKATPFKLTWSYNIKNGFDLNFKGNHLQVAKNLKALRNNKLPFKLIYKM